MCVFLPIALPVAVKKVGERRGVVHAETKVYYIAPCVHVEILKRRVGIK